MLQYDKFQIIEDHISSDNKNKITSKLENYFENYLNLDIHVLIPSYIEQAFWFKYVLIEPFINNIESHIKLFLIKQRNNMRVIIKKGDFELSELNKFLKIFIYKLEYLNTIIKISDNTIIKKGLHLLTNLIISDSFILMFIEDQVIMFNQSIYNEIKKLFKISQILEKYDNRTTFNKLLNTLGNIFKKHICNMEDLPLPDNIKRIQKLTDCIKYFIRINKYYNFINKQDINKYSFPIQQIIMEYLIDIIKNNDVCEIEFVLEKSWLDISSLIIDTYVEEKIEAFNNVVQEIIGLIDKLIALNNQTNIFKLINILKHTTNLIQRTQYKDIITQKIALLLSSDNNIDNIQFNIDQLIKQDKQDDVIKVLYFISTIKEKDIFINKYYEYLIKRLMEKFSEYFTCPYNKHPDVFENYIKLEQKIVELIKVKYGDRLVYKINKVISDTLCSFYDNLNFHKLKILSETKPELLDLDKISIITTSYNNWDVNQTEGIVNELMVENIKNTDTLLGQYLWTYQEFYKARYYSKRIINWFPHFGEINITYLNQQLKMLPIHFMVLEMFNNKDQHNVQTITDANFFANYTLKFKNDIIKSLITSNLFKLKANKLIISTSGTFKNDIISIFFDNSDYAVIWDQKRSEDFIHQRIDIVNANINNILKHTSMKKEDLFATLKNNINLFELDNNIFEQSINYMTKLDYINYDTDLNHYKKLIY